MGGNQIYDQQYGPDVVEGAVEEFSGELYDIDGEDELDEVEQYLEQELGDDADFVAETLYDVLEDVEAELGEFEANHYVEIDEEEEVMAVYRLERGEDEKSPYLDIAVRVMDMGDGLFGFTDTRSSHVNINRNLYSSEFEKTVSHEKEHQENPHLTELHIRYRNGDIDPENSLSMARYNHDDPRRSMAFDPGNYDSCC